MTKKRCIVNVATGAHFQRGQDRLIRAIASTQTDVPFVRAYRALPKGCPPHERLPYAFKVHALHDAIQGGARQVMWLDASIVPLRSMEPIWDHARQYGVWLSKAGYSNAQWTADSAYHALFPDKPIGLGRAINRKIPHVVGGAYCIDLEHPAGEEFYSELYRLVTTTNALSGPWINANAPIAPVADGVMCAPCGPPDVLGHRHDQSVHSVLAWRLGIPTTDPPRFFAYHGGCTEETILDADGGYE